VPIELVAFAGDTDRASSPLIADDASSAERPSDPGLTIRLDTD